MVIQLGTLTYLYSGQRTFTLLQYDLPKRGIYIFPVSWPEPSQLSSYKCALLRQINSATSSNSSTHKNHTICSGYSTQTVSNLQQKAGCSLHFPDKETEIQRAKQSSRLPMRPRRAGMQTHSSAHAFLLHRKPSFNYSLAKSKNELE